MKQQIDQVSVKINSLSSKRDQFLNEWRASGIKDMPLHYLQSILKENVMQVDNLDFTRKEQKADV